MTDGDASRVAHLEQIWWNPWSLTRGRRPHHKEFLKLGLPAIAAKIGPAKVVMDVKGCFSSDEATKLGIKIWRL